MQIDGCLFVPYTPCMLSRAVDLAAPFRAAQADAVVAGHACPDRDFERLPSVGGWLEGEFVQGPCVAERYRSRIGLFSPDSCRIED